MKQLKIILLGLMAVFTLSSATLMAMQLEIEGSSQQDSAKGDPDGWVPIDPESWATPQGSVPGFGPNSQNYKLRGRGDNLENLINRPQLKEILGLTEEQVEQLRKIKMDARKTAVRKRAEMQINRIELKELMRSEDPPRKQVKQKVQEISHLWGEMMEARIDCLLSIKSVLTPEQHRKTQELSSQKKRGVRRGKRQPRDEFRQHLRRGPSGPTRFRDRQYF